MISPSVHLGKVLSSCTPQAVRFLHLVRACLYVCALLPIAAAAFAATPVPEDRLWDAQWIAPAGASEGGYGVFCFRKGFTLAEAPKQLLVRVSADRRYRLFVNGVSVATGPQRGTASRWHYETLDIAPQLRAGTNVLAATVWNYGEDHPWALTSVRTAFILQAEGEAGRLVNTGAGWRVRREVAYAPLAADSAALNTFIVVGPGDRVDGRQLAWGWEQPAFDDSQWATARTLSQGTPEGVGTDLAWWLVPRTIPLPFEREQRFAALRRQEGTTVPEGFLQGRQAWIIAPKQSVRVLLDNGVETNAFPRLHVSGGRGAQCRLTYAEALVDAAGGKGNRNEVEGRRIVGVQDEFVADGGARRSFSPLNFRTYRYVQLEVTTGEEALTVHELLGIETGYPFEERGSFVSGDPRLKALWETGVRTAQLCAYETYMDCPYYEQMQYIGDTRIQALLSLYAFGDDRLVRNALEQFDRSRLPNGLTLSRAPTSSPQIIPPFSLFWVQMVRDYWMLRSDHAFVRARLPGIRTVLAWFGERIDPDTGLLGPMPYWNFVDWPDEWPWVDQAHPGGQAPGTREGGSAILSLHLALTLDEAAQLSLHYGFLVEAQRWHDQAARLRAAVRRHCWDAERRLFADTPAKTSRSQHVNALAVLAGASEGAEASDLMQRVCADRQLIQCTLYFRFYLLRAARKAGLGDTYLASLGPWYTMLERGLSTFAERPDPTRSDCHAWSASPVYELLATVCGVEPAAPGFAQVRLEPFLGELRQARGRVPHPLGDIDVEYTREGDTLRVRITLPPTVYGTLVWGGRERALVPGAQTVELVVKK